MIHISPIVTLVICWLGEGFVYNPGERVLGTTTPLYTGLMALAALPTGGTSAPYPSLAWLINALADGLTCLLLVRNGSSSGVRLGRPGRGAHVGDRPVQRDLCDRRAGNQRLYFAADRDDLLPLAEPAFLSRAAGLTGLFHPPRCHHLDRNGSAGSILAAPHQASRQARQEGRPALGFPWAEVLVFCLPTLAWIALSTAYFGSPLPHSIAAKSVAYRLSPEEGFIRLLQHYATPFQEHLTFGMPWLAVGMVLYPFLFLVGAWQGVRTAPRLWPWAVYPWVYFAIFAAANPLIFRWYLSPPLPAYMLFILIGAEHLVTSLISALFQRRRPANQEQVNFSMDRTVQVAVAILVVVLPVMLSLREWRLHPDHGPDRPAPDMAWFKLELLYRQAVDELAPDIQKAPGDPPTLAAGDVGVLGFFSGARILDTVGLNSPQSTGYYPLDPQMYVITYAIPPDLILDQQPDYVVILEVYGREGLLKDPHFREQYVLRRKIPTDIYGSDGLLIFERNKG